MLGLKQPKNNIANCKDEILSLCKGIEYPLILRPSYVIGGHKMQVLKSEEETIKFLNKNDQSLFQLGPLLIERYLEDATEIDVDAISDGTAIYIAGVMEHFEKAGIHSGDSSCSLPSFSLSKDILKKIEKYTITLCKTLKIQGIVNIQFAIKDKEIFILEVNPRASRTIPFVSKARGVSFVGLAVQLMMGEKLKNLKIENTQHLNYVYVKYPIFSFSQLPGVDPSLNSTMKSTGEVMGVGHTLEEATAKAFLSILRKKPKTKIILIKVNRCEELKTVPIIRELINLGYKIKLAMENKRILKNLHFSRKFIKIIKFNKNIITDGKFFNDTFLVINTLEEYNTENCYKNYRKNILKNGIIQCTTLQHARGLIRALQFYHLKDLEPISISSKELYQCSYGNFKTKMLKWSLC